MQFPIWGLPKDIGLKGAVFADAGTLSGYKGLTNFGQYLGYPAGTPSCAYVGNRTIAGTVNRRTPACHQQAGCITVGGNDGLIRSSVGVGLIWASPMGPIRFNYAFATSKSRGTCAAVQFLGRRELLIPRPTGIKQRRGF